MNLNKIENIKEFYNKASFSDTHGLEMFNVIVIFIIFFLLISYYTLLSKIDVLKKNWTNVRCDPRVLPFAGFINKEGSGLNSIEYTIQNFQGCTSNILKDISGFYFKPITYMIELASTVSKEFIEIINEIRKVFYKIRKEISNIIVEIIC